MVLSASQVIQYCVTAQIAYPLNLLCVPCSASRSSEFLEALIQFTNLIAGKALTLPNASLILSDWHAITGLSYPLISAEQVGTSSSTSSPYLQSEYRVIHLSTHTPVASPQPQKPTCRPHLHPHEHLVDGVNETIIHDVSSVLNIGRVDLVTKAPVSLSPNCCSSDLEDRMEWVEKGSHTL